MSPGDPGDPGEKPLAVVAKTVKGWGVREFQRSNYHGKPLKAEMMDEAMADLDAKAAELDVATMPDTPASEITAPPPVARPAEGHLSAGTFTEAMTAEMSATGGVLIMAIGLSLLDLKKIRVGNFLPALAIAPLVVALLGALGLILP